MGTHERAPFFICGSMAMGRPRASRGALMRNVWSMRDTFRKRACSAKCRPGQSLGVSEQRSELSVVHLRVELGNVKSAPASEAKCKRGRVSGLLVRGPIRIQESLGEEDVWVGIINWIV